jgi:HPt (histidine-containing phosphotransfer) domain-containing protein
VDGTAERCYEAGADDYLSKPLKLEELADKLDYWHGGNGRAAPADNTGPPTESRQSAACDPPIAIEELAGILGDDDRRVLMQVVQDFAVAWQRSLCALRQPLHSRDAGTLADAAHAASGLARYGAAPQLAVGCSRLEQLARARAWQEATETFATLELETERLATYLKDMR